MTSPDDRRRMIFRMSTASGLVLAAPLLAACGSRDSDVGAVEDLMREHGVLRRAILVFRESAARLQQGQKIDSSALYRTAQLFRSFGEEYHERKLEETYIFPAIKKAGGPAATYLGTLIAQHNRGREIIDYVMSVAGKGNIGPDSNAIAAALMSFELMYSNHATREDTIVFPAWKKALGPNGVEEMGDKFEDIEKQQFGGDGFDQAVQQIAEIEKSLGFDNLAQFTAPPPPGKI
jgi:hemerythrin-like domain-containing protein